MSQAMQPVGSTCTTVEENKQYAPLPPNTKGYLVEKVEAGLKAPRFITVRKQDGSTTISTLKQVVMSTAIRVDEYIADFYWQYKAEVTFDMFASIQSRGTIPPTPFLSSDLSAGPGRRHSLNPFPKGMVPGSTRRPDVIIVKNPSDRWPGRGTVDRENAAHVDNLMRVVEVKYPGDTWGQNQANDYRKISGGKERFSVLDVRDCNGDLEKALAREKAKAKAPANESAQERLRVPIRTVEPIPKPAWYEDWLYQLSSEIAAVWDSANQGAQHLSEETQAWLCTNAPWMFTTGRWVADAAGSAWQYVDGNSKTIFSYSAAQLKAAWQEIKKQCDLTWKQLQQIDWGHVAITALKGLAIMVLVIAGVCVVVVLAEPIAAIAAALIAIVELGGTALALIAAALGITGVAAAA
jgi:hypothetical protein